MATPAHLRAPTIRKKRTVSISAQNAPISAIAPSSLPQWLSLISLPFVAMSASALLYTLAAPFVDVQFTAVSREPNILLGGALGIWRVLELWIGWYLGFDDVDVFALFMQTRSPYYILLSMCYGVSGWTVIFYVLFDTLSPAAAFALLGRRRHPGTPHFLLQVSSEFRALHSWSNLLIVTFLSSAIYALGLYACAKTFLPTFIVTWFYPVITLEPVYDAQSLALAMYFAPLGWAARTVLFSRSAFGRNPLVWSPGLPYGSYLFVDFVQLKPWIRSDRGRELLKRTLAVFLITGVGNTLRTTHALEGSTVQGAAGWAAIWGVTGLLVNAVLIWVGSAAWINEKKPSEY